MSDQLFYSQVPIITSVVLAEGVLQQSTSCFYCIITVFSTISMQETHHNVTIKEISGEELSKIGDDQKQYEWTFEITVTVREQNGS